MLALYLFTYVTYCLGTLACLCFCSRFSFVQEELQTALIAIATQTLEAIIFVGGVIASLCMLFTILTYVTSQ